MVTKLNPSAVVLTGVAVTETLPTMAPPPPPPPLTEYPADAVNPLADAVMYVAFGVAVVAGERVMVATPLVSVKALAWLNVPKVVSVLKDTTSFAIGAPLASFKVAVTVAGVAVVIELVVRAITKVAVPVVVPGVPGVVVVLLLHPAIRRSVSTNKNETDIFVNF